MRHIPNIITSLNLTAGFLSIVFAANGEVLTASWLIIAAMIFDWFDGFSARLLKAYSDIGKELDSLADAVSFGIAPALIMYHLLGTSVSLSYPMILNAEGKGEMLILLTPVVMCVCAVIRLAIFNNDASQARSFKGLPTPANALAVISLVIAAHYSDRMIFKNILGSNNTSVNHCFAFSFNGKQVTSYFTENC
jgi:CDP-diacylglycerol--serine O-phosphatidyltransferase